MEARTRVLLAILLTSVFYFPTLEAAAQDVKDRAIKLGYAVAKDHPYGLGVAKFGELTSQKSNGKFRVTGYSDGQLGAEAATISATQGGVMEMTLVSSAPAVVVVKEF